MIKGARLLLIEFVLSVIICVGCFPDVVFYGASFRPAEVHIGHLPLTKLVALKKEPPWRQHYHGYNDVGTSVWGLEPGQLFVSRAIAERQSSFWNPYAAAGSLGVESLTDAKWAPFSILVALFGPSSLAFHLCYFALLVVSLMLLFRLLRVHFDVGWLGGAVAGVVYALNGMHMANITNVVVQPYLYAPFLLTTLLHLVDRPSWPRASAAALAHAAVLSSLFLATSQLIFIACYLVALTYALSRRAGLRWLPWALGSGVLGCLLLAPILVPTAHSLTYLDTLRQYNQRVTDPTHGLAFLSVFTPHHFWESYAAFYDSKPPLGIRWQEASWIFHLGIATAVIALQAFSGPLTRRSWPTLAIAGLVVLGVGRAFNHLPFSVFSHLPLLRGIQAGYWNCLTGLFAALLAGIGVAQVQRRGGQWIPLVSATLMIISAFAVLYFTYGWPTDPLKQHYLRVGGGVLLFCIAALVLSRAPRLRAVSTVAIAIVLSVELFSYVNTLRPRRLPVDRDLAGAVPELARLRGPHRTLSIGRFIVPPEWGAAYNIYQADGFRESMLPWYRDFFYGSFGQPIQQMSFGANVDEVPSINLPRASYLSVRYFIVGTDMPAALAYVRQLGLPEIYTDRRASIFENRAFRPRAQLFGALAGGPVPVGADAVRLEQQAFSTDPALIAAARQLGIADSPRGTEAAAAAGTAAGTATIVEDGHAEVTIQADLPQPMILSLADTWHPRWRVFIDGVPGTMGRLNDAFRGVALPAGSHRVTFRYQPTGMPYTAAISGLALLLILASFVPWRRLRT